MDKNLEETCVDSEAAYTGRFLKITRDKVRLPDGKITEREYIRHPGAVVILPLLADGKVLLERQYRYPLHRVFIEFPAGKIDVGEDPLACAQRELREETGFAARQWAFAGAMHNCIAYSDERIDIWFARDLHFQGQALDAGELLQVYAATLPELLQRTQCGELTDAKTLTALLWLQQTVQGVWPLDWQHHPAD